MTHTTLLVFIITSMNNLLSGDLFCMPVLAFDSELVILQGVPLFGSEGLA